MDDAGSRDRSHLTLDLNGLKQHQTNIDSGLSPISVPQSLFDTTLTMSPEKLLFATQQQLQQQVHNQNLETPTPSNFFSKNPTSAQESFVEGFEETLKKIHGGNFIASINNTPSAQKFINSLLSRLSPNGAGKNFLAQPVLQTPPNSNANQLLSGTDGAARLLEVPQIVLNNSLISAAAAAVASSTAGTIQVQQNSPISVAVEGSAAAAAVTSDSDSANYMDYHLAQLGHLSPAETDANNAAAVEFFQPHLAQFNASVPMGIVQQQHPLPSKDCCSSVKKEQSMNNNNAADNALLQQHQNQLLNGGGGQCSVLRAAQQQHHHHRGNNGDGFGGRSNSKGSDVGDHDMKKLERKRARNRLAASKCRQRKLQRITDLEQQVNEERERGAELQLQIGQLHNVIRTLEERLKAGEHQHHQQQQQQQQHHSVVAHRQHH
uniref:BZIP domain-containing protein n=1 Tax=Globodera pallida TaxID=36090 RepID=A0A183BK00_GLOPA